MSVNYKTQSKWIAENTVRVALSLNIRTDADILAKLDTVPSKQGYIKELIRRDLAGEKEDQKRC